MKKTYTLGVIGGGFMAKAILDGAISKGIISPQEIVVSEPSEERRKLLSKNNIHVVNDNIFTVNNSRFVLFSVKPQNFSAVANHIKGADIPVIISIMAGVTKQSIQNFLGGNLRIARAMPNLPCSIGEGMTGLDANGLTVEEREFVKSLFLSVGKVILLNEGLLNAVTGLSGSGPAYVFLFMQSLVEAGIAQGLSENDSFTLALQTMKGGIKLIENNGGQSIDELIAAVSSKGGTTVAALESLAFDNWKESVKRAVDCAVKRAEELSL